MKLAVISALVLGLSSVAVAQPGLTPVQEPDRELPQPAPSRPPAPVYYQYEQPMPAPIMVVPNPVKSEGTATMLALGTTAAGFVLMAAGGQSGGDGAITMGLLTLLVGPSAGHIYAGESGHAVGMTLVRGAALVAFVAGVIKSTMVYGIDCVDCESSNSGDRDNAGTLMWVGGLSFIAASVYDIIDAPRAARRRNAKERSYMVQPMFVQAPGGAVPAVGLGGKF
ncbi:MAG: hypothetical protein H0V17_04495 [Deltaproteobacteria bacterium]|nr:hypothetical protein [Deltaproteobacteria bacterium]